MGTSGSRNYIEKLQNELGMLDDKEIHKAISFLHKARNRRNNVFVIGNGGSASTASHIVCDLAKNTRDDIIPHMRVFDLTSQPVITAYANDEGYENIFVNQLDDLINLGDVLIAISTSGNSPNIINAVDYARKWGATVIGLTGFNGGKLRKLSTINIHVSSDSIERIEDIHLAIGHIFCTQLRMMAIEES